MTPEKGFTMASNKIKFWSIVFAAVPVIAIVSAGGFGGH
jgi:hypothetical protein